VCLVAACAPKAEMTVTPRRACGDQPIVIQSRTKGTETLTATTIGMGPGADTTRFKVSAVRHGDTAFAETDVIVAAKNGIDVPLFLQHAAASGNGVVWSDTLLHDEWGGQFAIQTLANRSKLPLDITHAGRTATLDSAGSPVSTLQGLPPDGPWSAHAMVSADAAPTHLELALHLTCVPTGPTP
jgi:hypothetical protein